MSAQPPEDTEGQGLIVTLALLGLGALVGAFWREIIQLLSVAARHFI